MPEDFRLIVDLVLVLAAATIGGLLASLLRQPAILGYLIGGIIVGPGGLGVIKELIQVETLAQFGVAFLLFALGVEFSFAELKKVQGISLGGGGLQIVFTILITALTMGILGWDTSPIQGIFLGAILSLSSTAVVLKCLMERNEMASPQGQIMLGILVVQDLALGLMLAVLPALNQPEGGVIFEAVGRSLLLIGLFALGAVIAGIWVIPKLLQFLAKTESKELFLLGVVALCLGIALLTEHLGFSIEMGAFVAGLMISEVEYADQTLTYVEPIRDIFAALFFVAVGMLIDPIFLWEHLELIIGLMLLIVAGKTLIIIPIVKLFGYSWRTSIITGLGLAQIGEFSFVLASAGQGLGLVSRRVYLLIVGTTALTLIITPFILQFAPKLLDWIEEKWDLSNLLENSQKITNISEDLPQQNHIIVCGYGRVGRNLVQLLQSHNYAVIVIDQSEKTVQELRNNQIPYLYGNAASLHVLEAAGVDRAASMAIALPDPMSTRLCLKRSLEFSPNLDVIVIADRDKDIELLYQLGAKEVVQPEFEASLELSNHVLTKMGLGGDKIQQEMQKIRQSQYSDFRPKQSAQEVARDLQQATQEMNSKWYALPTNSPLMGMTLEESNIRPMTGISIMAIRRFTGEEIDYPDGQVRLEKDDKLLVVGEAAALETLDQLAKGEVTIPAESISCQWLNIPENSQVIGKSLSKLDLANRFGVQVQALRREDKFYRWPNRSLDLEAGDRLLLCGSFHDLNQARREMIPINIPPLKILKEIEIVEG
ncbi:MULTISPECIES: cation:proton antiporter [Planktothrix]|jgi:CPA2 family monovalent cation:H+ antiporter-2|uniref:Sodium/hydrogen exchanger family protein n=2 Tax=Planktothrix TaxID=54304 RepID=A0A6J7ZTT0_PLARU|nr:MULTISPECIES: cation:proton antiporter [Planktothrix]CAD5915186.1 K(+) efflux antiporter 4 [Planktothrix rubescens]CAC5345894.1 Sodium/hydrogen exchanger family protein [Planktothrix rubescens NIVA-CYA 18]CAD5951903.1 K(+) efflux antiporter 4 [Planktothrix rubescens NIVA-CYA 18]CAH2573130.1 K(+) efflux antiporter 4 [Planktothrix rubescens]GDZ92555.1 putative potassium/proton antiporter [Planktothrix agardhii CCAP 1459/11A]